MDERRHRPEITLPTLVGLVLACAPLLGAGCSKTGSDDATARTGAAQSTAAAEPAEPPAPDTDDARPAEPAARAARRPRPAPTNLLPTGVERRLHPAQAEASSFLWNDWNRFQENYHPLYLVDDDPATAWVEGAAGSGAGSWVRVHVTPVDGATRVRLRLRNGYHKSRSLFEKNARARKLTVVLLPGGAEATVDVADDMKWQELSVEQPEGSLDAVELRVDEVYEGTRYADLCLSDLEVHVTARTPENPAFEKSKLGKVAAWKAQRVATAAMFRAGSGRAMPIGPGYRVREVTGDVRFPDDPPDPAFARLAFALAQAPAHLPDHAAVVDRAHKLAGGSFDDWTPVQLVPRDTRPIPPVDGLASVEAVLFGGTDDTFAMPLPNVMGLLSSRGLGAFERTDGPSIADVLESRPRACKNPEEPAHFFWRPPAPETGKQVVDALLSVTCAMEDGREGPMPLAIFQLLVYDGDERLALLADGTGVSGLRWKQGEAGPVLAGGRRLQIWGTRADVDELVEAEAARP